MKLHSNEKILLLAVAVIGLASVMGFSFAYFVSSVDIKGDQGSTNVGSAAEPIKVVYDAGTSAIDLENAYPGKSVSKDFKVTVTPTNVKTVTYAIILNITKNEFVKCVPTTENMCDEEALELVYRVKNKSDNAVLATGDLVAKTGSVELLKETKTLEANEDFEYVLEIEFVNTNKDQNHNINKTFEASLNVEFAN